MPKQLIKSTAIRESRRYFSTPWGSGTSWVYSCPYRFSEPAGPTTESKASSYAAIVRRRSISVVHLALVLMGYEDSDAAYVVECAADRFTTMGDIFDAALSRLGPVEV